MKINSCVLSTQNCKPTFTPSCKVRSHNICLSLISLCVCFYVQIQLSVYNNFIMLDPKSLSKISDIFLTPTCN